jgi:predicted extracellular nuclease
MLVLLAATAQAQLAVNEIDYDQPSTDTAEFIEIKNVSAGAVDLSAFRLDLVNGSDGSVYQTFTLPAVNLAAGGYFVVCANSANTANCDLDVAPDTNLVQNGAPDAVALMQGTTLIDTVSYEGDVAGFTEGSGAGLTDDPGVDGAGISRFPDGADTDQNNIDFSLRCITPGAANAAAATDCVFEPPNVLINEIDADQTDTDAAEFVELYDGGIGNTVLDGLVLVLFNGSDDASYAAFDLDGLSTGGGGYFVLCGDAANVAGCDLDVTPETNLLQNGADAVALLGGDATDFPNGTPVTTSNLVDALVYGTSDADDAGLLVLLNAGQPQVDENANAASTAESIGRCPNGTGGARNTASYTPSAPTPGADNDCEQSVGTLVINEIDYDQPGTDTTEFIEIKNAGGGAVNLAGFALELVNGTGGGAAVYATIPLPAVTLPVGEYFVVCGDAATTFGCDLDVSPDSNLIQNGAPDAVALRFDGLLVDTVSYEGNTGAPFTEGTGVGLEDSGATGQDFHGISRFPDGADTNINNVDFSNRCVTPGAANTEASSGCMDPRPPALRINEIDYDQPSADTAEFIEIVNAGSSPADLAGVELQLVNGNGGGAAVYATVALPAISLAPSAYFVVCATGASVPDCDLAGFDSIQNGAPDAVTLIRGGLVIDTVSYEGDTAAPHTEGSGAGLEDTGASGQDHRGISRFPDGVDTDQNNVDLVNACITPGFANTSLTAGCSAGGPVLEIFAIQGSGAASPFASQGVATEDNIVTAVGPDGFFIQTPDARADASAATSNGIFVFTGSAPTVAVGDQVDVAGQVVEFFDFTEFGTGATVSVNSSGHALPAATVFDETVPSPDPMAPSCAVEYECYEGMLIQITGGTVTGPNQRFGTDPVAEVHVTAAPARAFREPGIEFPGLPGLPEWDGNPEVFELDADKLGLGNPLIPAGSSFDATGTLGFEFGGYELWVTSLTVDEALLPQAVRARQAGEMTIGALNLFRLFDDVDDPPIEVRGPDSNAVLTTTDDAVVDSAEYAVRLAKFSTYIRSVLDAPDVLAVSEVESLKVLRDLADRIHADDAAISYTPYLEEGNDIGGIDVGFLVQDTVAVDTVTQLGRFETLSVDGSLLNDRPPLLLEGRQIAGGSDFPFAVMAIHGRSLGSIESSTRVRQKRFEQAQSVAAKVQALQAADPDINLVVTGDFNAFEFTDGFVDVTGQMKGSFAPEDNLVCDTNACDDLVDPDLLDQVLMIPTEERYSFIFGGSAQVLDHALTSSGLDELVRDFRYGRGNADAAVILIDDGTTPLRSSDHDGLVLFLAKDSDGDGVTDGTDQCPGTVIPEAVPFATLGINHWALTDDDREFDTASPPGKGSEASFDIFDTAGCSCEQIVEAQGLGAGHLKFGCSIEAMQEWVDLVGDP